MEIMYRTVTVVAFVIAMAGCSEPDEPDPSPVGDVGGLYHADGRPNLDIFLYDEVADPVAPETFFVRARTPSASLYWWGTFTLHRDSIFLAPFSIDAHQYIGRTGAWLSFGDVFQSEGVRWVREPGAGPDER